jgi:hypothetical protein
MEVFLSSEFKDVFEAFIVALEGTNRPLDRVNADFLKHQVEINLLYRDDQCVDYMCLSQSSMCITYSVMNTLLESFLLIPLGSVQNSLPTEVKTLSSNMLYNALVICRVCHCNNCYTHRCGGGLAVLATQVSLIGMLVL